jgi:hypothetical protein
VGLEIHNRGHIPVLEIKTPIEQSLVNESIEIFQDILKFSNLLHKIIFLLHYKSITKQNEHEYQWKTMKNKSEIGELKIFQHKCCNGDPGHNHESHRSMYANDRNSPNNNQIFSQSIARVYVRLCRVFNSNDGKNQFFSPFMSIGNRYFEGSNNQCSFKKQTQSNNS